MKFSRLEFDKSQAHPLAQKLLKLQRPGPGERAAFALSDAEYQLLLTILLRESATAVMGVSYTLDGMRQMPIGYAKDSVEKLVEKALLHQFMIGLSAQAVVDRFEKGDGSAIYTSEVRIVQ